MGVHRELDAFVLVWVAMDIICTYISLCLFIFGQEIVIACDKRLTFSAILPTRD